MAYKDICIIVVWFNPTDIQISCYVDISKSCQVIAIDNSSESSLIPNHTDLLEYIPLHNNVGIAKAQNIGIAHAKSLGYKHVVFFDQDTTPNVEDLHCLYDDFYSIKKEDPQIAAIGPCLIDEKTGNEYANYRHKAHGTFQKVEMVMSTSTLTSIEILDSVGYMDESLFIDFVDHEWCWRATHLGYNIYQTENVKIRHSVGKRVIKFLGYERPISSPQRYYYQFRNSIWLMHYDCPPSGWRKRVIPRLVIELLFIALYNRAALHYAFRGIKEGFKNKRHI